MLLVRDDIGSANEYIENKAQVFEEKLNILEKMLDNFANNSSNELKGIDWQRLFNIINDNQRGIRNINKNLSELKENIKTANQLFSDYIDTKPSDYVQDINDDYLPELEALRDDYYEKMENLKWQINNPVTEIIRYDEETGDPIYGVVTDIDNLQSEYDECEDEYNKYVKWIAFLEELAPTNESVKGAVNASNIVDFNYIGVL